ncbi:SET domain-containing protein [Xylaria sp. CBS 124048]|nr:SET domain-containing protein [Xylaria sp. CBS 124048]
MAPALPDGLLLKGSTSAPRGRHVVATRSFQPGEVIATFTSPSLAISDSPSLAITCSGCLAPGAPVTGELPPVRACGGCRTVAYCSPACQKLDWNSGGHKAECKVFRRVRAEGHAYLPTLVRALLHILLRPELRAAMADLEGHADKFIREGGQKWADTELQAMGALQYSGLEKTKENFQEALEIACKLKINSFTRLDEDIQQTGIFMNPALSMVNHSCIPNAYTQCIGRNAVLHASREIKKDEEIEISYIDHSLHLANRQEAFRTRYHFRCSCARCKDDLSVYDVCRAYPHLDLNSLSLQPDIQKMIAKFPTLTPGEKASLNATVEEIFPSCSASIVNLSGPEKAKELRRRWQACKPLRCAPVPLFAIAPFPDLLADAAVYFMKQGNPDYSLCVSSFIATQVDPYISPAPFAIQRVKQMLLLARTGVTLMVRKVPQPSVQYDSLEGRVIRAVRRVDLSRMCQVLLELIVHYGPTAHSEEWPVVGEAKELLKWQYVGRREEVSKRFRQIVKNPTGAKERGFLDHDLLDYLRELSSFCMEIMEKEFGA